MLTFIVPVKSKSVSGDWEHFSKLFERTLKSICSQTSTDIRVVVVCNEQPNTQFEDPRIEYLTVDFDPPRLGNDNIEKHNGLREEDKSKKILAGAAHIEQYDQDYVMVVDADDCISNQIASYVLQNSSEDIPGWYFEKGYMYREGDRFIALNKKNFNTLCGTCIIVKPHLIKRIIQPKPYLLYVHQSVKLTEHEYLLPFPIPGSVYSMANGENHFMSGSKARSLVTGRVFHWSVVSAIIRKLRKYRIRLVSRAIKEEFGLYEIS